MFGRNTNHLNALLIAVGKGTRKTAIAQWVLAHAPVVMESDKDKMKENPFKFSADKVEALLQAMPGWEQPDNYKQVPAEMAERYALHVHTQHWTEHKEPPLVPETWSLRDAVVKLLQQAKTLEGKGTKVQGGDMRGRLQELLDATEPQYKEIASV